MASKEVKDLFWKWSQEVLQEERFEKCRDVDKWAEYVRIHDDWSPIQNNFLKAVYERWNTFEVELQKTPEGRERLIKMLEIGNEEMIKNIRAGHHG